MFKGNAIVYLISVCSFVLIASFLTFLQTIVGRKRAILLERLHHAHIYQAFRSEDILERPLIDRTVGPIAQWLVAVISHATPQQAKNTIGGKLEMAGNPYGLQPADFLALQSILGITAVGVSWFLLDLLLLPFENKLFLAITIGLLAAFLPWFMLAKSGTKRQQEIKRSLPDIMDLLVVSVEAGLAFDMALTRVVEKFQGSVAYEFQRALREIQLGKSRKDALKDMAERVDLPELSSLVNAIIQSDQLGVGLGNVLRLQADLIREKRQQWIEEQAMKAPVKMLFPLVICIFPSIFVVILGPAVLSIMKMFAGR